MGQRDFHTCGICEGLTFVTHLGLHGLEKAYACAQCKQTGLLCRTHHAGKCERCGWRDDFRPEPAKG